MITIFISATTADLASARTRAKRGLETNKYAVVEQDTFGTDYGTMLQRLERKFAECDGIVHIAGFVYGAEPPPETLPPDTPRRSYTQWEYHLALKIRKKRPGFRIYAFLTADDYPAPSSGEAEELRQLQLQHRELLSPIMSSSRIASDGELEEKVKEIQLALEHERFRRRLLQTTLTMLATPIVLIALGAGLNQYACQAPGLHALCKKYGWGGVPTLAEETAFTLAAAQGCDGLRDYLRQDAPLVLQTKAQGAIDARDVQYLETWVQEPPRVRKVEIGLGKAKTGADEQAAKASSEGELRQQAQAHCMDKIASGDYRAPQGRDLVKVEAVEFQCEPYRQHKHCAATLQFVCQADALEIISKESCHASIQ